MVVASLLVAEGLHQVAPLGVEATLNVQLSEAVKETVWFPSVDPKDNPLETRVTSIVISDLLISGFGVGSTGSSPPPLHAERDNRIANIANPMILNVFTAI